jgi:hypothetical protein
MGKAANKLIGCVTGSKELKIFGLDGKVCVEADLSSLKEAWQKTLRSF